MLINPLIKIEYPTVNAFQGANQIRQMISTHGSALVLSEDSVAMGVITAHDLASRPYNLVIDCLTDKPVISKQHLIPEVLMMMQEVHSDLLMVCENGELVGVVHKKDITDYLCRSVEEQMSRMHSIAHDLKNPLSSVLSVTYLLEDSGGIAPDNRELIGMAQEACTYATNIINDILFHVDNQSKTSNREPVELNTLIKECTYVFNIGVLQKRLQVNLLLLHDTCYVEAERIKLKRAICNILSNAIKFTPQGGSITIEVKQIKDGVLIAIRDNGIGIPVELQTHLFEKFSQAKRTGTNGENSTGLGMYITRQIIESQDGKIWLESEDKRGTAVFIQLNIKNPF